VSPKYAILSLFLLIAVFLLSLENYKTWTGSEESITPKETVRRPEKKPEVPASTPVQKEASNIKSYITLAEKNIFNPERKDFPTPTLTSAMDPAKKPLVRPQIILYGVTTYGTSSSAIISVQGTSLRKGERESMTVQLGEKVGEYRLAKILPDRITMEASEDSFDVLLYDSKVPKQRSHIKTEAKPATVTSTLPGAAPGAAPPPAAKAPTPPVPSQPLPALAKPTVPSPRTAPPAISPGPVSPSTPATPLPRPQYRRGRSIPTTPPPPSPVPEDDDDDDDE